MRKGILAAAGGALLATLISWNAQAMPLAAPAALKDASESLSHTENVCWGCGGYGYGYRPYYRPYGYGYGYRPYYRPYGYGGYGYYRPYYRPYGYGYGYHPRPRFYVGPFVYGY
jgi:hypothetical protein